MLIYYFLTSLKPLVLYQTPPIRRADFLCQLKDCLDDAIMGDLALLEEAWAIAKKNETLRRLYWDHLATHARSPFLRDWAQKMFFMYQEIAKLLKGQEIHPSLALFRQALLDSDPLSLEKTQAEYIFYLLEEGLSHDTFSYDQVFAYFIKLELCERFASFDYQQGKIVLDDLIKSVCEVSNDN